MSCLKCGEQAAEGSNYCVRHLIPEGKNKVAASGFILRMEPKRQKWGSPKKAAAKKAAAGLSSSPKKPAPGKVPPAVKKANNNKK